jgi:hypothetical protein
VSRGVAGFAGEATFPVFPVGSGILSIFFTKPPLDGKKPRSKASLCRRIPVAAEPGILACPIGN